MPVLACTGASIKTMMCALVCIGACFGLYLGLYWSVLVGYNNHGIGIVLVIELESVLALLKKVACIWSVFARIIIS